MKKKVLIITYYWPPSGGPGVQRVLKFVKYLPDFGWEPVVVTVKNGEYPAIDLSLQQEVDPNLKVYRVASLELFDLFRKITGKKKGDKIETYELVKGKNQLSFKEKMAQFIRINFLIPDARIGWNLIGYRKCLEIVKTENPDIIFSSSPPHSLQILASRLAKKTQTKWIADFRDPWTKSFYDKGTQRWLISELYNQKLERKVVYSADCITAVSQGVLDLVGADFGKKTKVISNGFDSTDFSGTKTKNANFTIVYTGHIASVQNPEKFFSGIARLLNDTSRKIKIEIYGSADRSVHDSVLANDLTHITTFHSYVAHREVTRIMTQADLLLLLIPQENSKGILTGKLFEYLAANNFILGIGDEEGVAAAVLKQCEAGVMLDYSKDPYEIILAQYNFWLSNEKHQGNQEEIQKYSRKNLTKELSSLFSEICG